MAAPKSALDSEHKTKKITIGVFDSYDSACLEGNVLMEKLENKFPLHRFPDGSTAKKERFSKYGGSFGSKKSLISDSAYLKTPFSFFAQITTLKYEGIDDTIEEVVGSVKKYKAYKRSENGELHQ